MNIKELLIKARSFIENKDSWTQGYFAKNSDGFGINPDNENAVCFCSWGAMEKAAGHRLDLEDDNSLRHLKQFMDYNIPKFNDHHTHAEVLAAFDAAIAAAE